MNKKIMALIGLALISLMALASSITFSQEPINENESVISFQEEEKIILTSSINYKFPLLTDINEECDLHWVRMQVYYYCSILPDSLTKADPHLFIGFNEPLNEIQEKCLNQVMSNKGVCLEPKGIKCMAYTDITPQALESKTMNAIGRKPMYYSNGTRVWIILFDDLTVKNKTDIQTMLKEMWTIECK